MADNNPIKYSDLVQPDDSITKLIAQLDELSDAYKNTLDNIKSEAVTVKVALQGVSGATEQGRKAIKSSATDADKLTKAYKELAFAESENAKKLAELKEAQREASNINKLLVKLNNSAEGSYNRLSAQYSLNKITLNGMTVAEREGTEEGRKLVAETNAIYQEMKRLQEVTGKTSLNVGNYAEATVSLKAQLKQLTDQMMQLRMEGKQNTEEYQRLAQKAGQLKDVMLDTKQEIKNLASDTSNLDAILSFTAGASGGFTALTGAMELFGAESEDVEKAQKTLQAAIALTTGVQQIQNVVQKQSAAMLAISKVQTMALAKAEAYERLIKIQGTKATMGATVAQKAFNLVASANPYVLLATALISVVGALYLFSKRTEDGSEAMSKMTNAEENWLEYLKTEEKTITRVSDERIAQLNRELNIARARGASAKEINSIEDKIAKERRKRHIDLTNYYDNEIDHLEENRRTLSKYNEMLLRLKGLENRGDKTIIMDINLDGKVDKMTIEKAIAEVQARVKQYGQKVEIGTTLVEEGKDLEAEEKERQVRRAEEARKRAKEMRKTAVDEQRKTEDARLELIDDEYKREIAQRKLETKREKEDIRRQLKEGENLNATARAQLNNRLKLADERLRKDLEKMEKEHNEKMTTLSREVEDVQISAMAEGAKKRREALRVEYDRRIKDIHAQAKAETNEQAKGLLLEKEIATREEYNRKVLELNNTLQAEQLQKEVDAIQLRLDAVEEGSEKEIQLRSELLNKQRDIELQQNRQLAQDMQQSEEDINKKYDAMIAKTTAELTEKRTMMLLNQQQELDASEFDLLRNSEEKKTQFKLKQEKERIDAVLKLAEDGAIKISDKEIEVLKNTSKRISNEIKQSKARERSEDIYGLLGLNLDDDRKEAINESVSFATDQINTLLDAKLKAADLAVEAANKEVDNAKSNLEKEIEARNNGYASNVIQAQKELDLAKKTQEKALKEQAKAQKQQAALQALQQMGDLATGTAKIIAQLGIWAAPAVAAMWALFAASKIKAAQVTKQQTEQYGEGTVELLQGGSHQSGNDIDLGTKADGTKRRAEGGEFFAVINKRSSRRYRKMIPEVIKALNNGTFTQKYMNAYKGSEGLSLNVSGGATDITDLKNDVRAIKEQNSRRTYVDADGSTIIEYKNLTRRIRR